MVPSAHPEAEIRPAQAPEVLPEPLAAEVAMLREALKEFCDRVGPRWFLAQGWAYPLAVLDLPTNHAAILARRDARTLRKAAAICSEQHDKARTSPGAARALACEERILAIAIKLESLPE